MRQGHPEAKPHGSTPALKSLVPPFYRVGCNVDTRPVFSSNLIARPIWCRSDAHFALLAVVPALQRLGSWIAAAQTSKAITITIVSNRLPGPRRLVGGSELACEKSLWGFSYIPVGFCV